MITMRTALAALAFLVAMAAYADRAAYAMTGVSVPTVAAAHASNRTAD